MFIKVLNMLSFTNVRLAASSSLKNVIFSDTNESENRKTLSSLKQLRLETKQRSLRSPWGAENQAISNKRFERVFIVCLFFLSKLEMR